MKRTIFWNRRSGIDRRAKTVSQNPYEVTDDRRVNDRRLYRNNGYLLIIGHTGIDRFTLFVSIPLLAILAIVLLV